MKDDMIARGAIQLTIKTLHFLLSELPVSSGFCQDAPTLASAANVCLVSFRLLATLCQKDRGHHPTATSTLDVVLRCLAVPQLCGADALLNGSWLVMNLIDKRFEHQELIRTSDGITLLLGLLDAELLHGTQASARLCSLIAGGLAKIVQEHKRNQQALFEADGIALLLRALKTFCTDQKVVANVCMAIYCLTQNHESIQHACRVKGAIPLIMEALLAYRGDNAVLFPICRVIAALTEMNAANQQAFLTEKLLDGNSQTGALPLLLQAFSRTSELHMVTTMSWALGNLTVGDPRAMDCVRRLGGPEVVLLKLKRFAKEEQACEYLCTFLRDLVHGDCVAASRNRQELKTLGASQVITEMKEHHEKSNGYVLVRALEFLQKLNA